MPRLRPLLVAALLAAAALPAAALADDPADEPPFGGETPPPLVRPPSETKPPPGFELDARRATALAAAAPAVRAERAADGPLRAVAFERGSDRWQVNFFTGSGRRRQEVALAVVDDSSGAVLEAWRDQQVTTKLARGYSGAIAQLVNAPYVWLPLCALFIVPFLDPRRPFRLLHLDLLVLLGLGVSLYFFNRADIRASVALTYPVLGYVLARMLIAGLRPRRRAGPLVPLVPIRLLAIAAVALGAGRIALNVADSRVIDIGVAGAIGADRIERGQPLYDGRFDEGLPVRGDVYGPFNYLAYVPFEEALPFRGEWDSVPAAHAAAIAFDLLTALGLLALGRRLRAGPDGRALGVAMAFAWLAYPFTLYTMNANANDSLVAATVVGAMLAITSPVGRGVMVALGAAAKFGTAALAPLFATATGERRLRSTLLFAVAFAAIVAAVFVPFIPDGGVRELYDRTLGYQASRSSPFSVWGLAPSLDFLQSWVRAAALALALAVAVYPRTKSPPQVAALAAAVVVAVQLGATHWFYFYAVWFLPLVLAAAFAAERVIVPVRVRRRAPTITAISSPAAPARTS
jgi:glycosyl transferase family 87